MSNKSNLRFDESAPHFLELLKERYQKEQDPIDLMRAFTTAVEYDQKIPSWIIEKLDKVFKRYLDHEPDRSLDDLMGCTGGKGQSPARTKAEKSDMYARVMMDLDILVRHGVNVKDAIKITLPSFFQGFCIWALDLSI